MDQAGRITNAQACTTTLGIRHKSPKGFGSTSLESERSLNQCDYKGDGEKFHVRGISDKPF